MITVEQKPGWEKPYRDWLRRTLGVEISPGDAERYENTARELANQFRQHEFWEKFVDDLNARSAEINDTTPYQLLPVNDRYDPQIVAKSHKSILNKSWRLNVLNNDNWPNPPTLRSRTSTPGPPITEWITPDNWLVRMNDVVRTTVVVRYLDGVHIVKDLLEKTAQRCRLDAPSCDFESRAEGYYAVHFYVTLSLPFRNDTEWTSEKISVEVQTHTQLHEVLRTLTHQHYEKRRNEPPVSPEVWTWNDEDPAFVPNFLGHILQYTDGMLMSIRKKPPMMDELIEE